MGVGQPLFEAPHAAIAWLEPVGSYSYILIVPTSDETVCNGRVILVLSLLFWKGLRDGLLWTQLRVRTLTFSSTSLLFKDDNLMWDTASATTLSFPCIYLISKSYSLKFNQTARRICYR